MRRATILLVCVLLTSSCTQSGRQSGGSGAGMLPTGAYLEPSGFITVGNTTPASYANNSAEHGAGRVRLIDENVQWSASELDNWRARLESTGVPLQPRAGSTIDIALTETAFREQMKSSQVNLPNSLPLTFKRSFDLPLVDESLVGLVKTSFGGSQALQIPTIGDYGTLRLSDGCLLLERQNGERSLAVLPEALGLTRDEKGYVAVRYRYSHLSEPLARVGNRIGPFEATEGGEQFSSAARDCGVQSAIQISDARNSLD